MAPHHHELVAQGNVFEHEGLAIFDHGKQASQESEHDAEHGRNVNDSGCCGVFANHTWNYVVLLDQTRVELYIDAPIAIGTKGFAITRVPAVMGCMFLLMSDMAALFPKLRWGFIESTAQWVPWIYNEAARRYASVGKPFPDDIFAKSNIFITCQDDDDLPWILRYSGEHTLMTGTDYGHTDPAAKLDAISQFRARTDIGVGTKARILQDNPKALYSV